MSAKRERQVDALIVGAGPAGLATAIELRRLGLVDVEVVERESQAGGIPRHSHHTGFGLRDLRRVMTGPAYARHYAQIAQEAGARIRTGVTATGWSGPLSVELTSQHGLERLKASVIVLATGARERPRHARLVPGARPDGVYTTGHLQQAICLRHQRVGTQAVIVGAEHVSYSAAVTLHRAGVQVAAMLTELPRSQSFVAFDGAARLRYGFPLMTRAMVTQILGHHRVEGVEVHTSSGVRRVIDCDTVIFTGDWIPDNELARHGKIDIDGGTLGPTVDTTLQTSRRGVFAVGNLVHAVETADVVAQEGRAVARALMSGVRSPVSLATDGDPAAASAVGVQIEVAPPLRWVAPNRLATLDAPPNGHFVLWCDEFRQSPRYVVRQGDALLFSRRSLRTLVPNRALHLEVSWLSKVDLGGPPVRIRVTD